MLHHCLWILYGNHEIPSHGSLVDFYDPYSKALNTVLFLQAPKPLIQKRLERDNKNTKADMSHTTLTISNQVHATGNANLQATTKSCIIDTTATWVTTLKGYKFISITHISRPFTTKSVLFYSRSEGALMCKSSLTVSSLSPLSIKQIHKYRRKRHVPLWEGGTNMPRSDIPLYSFQRNSGIGQGDTTSKESHSPLNLSFDSLIVSYSSHVGGIVAAIKKKKTVWPHVLFKAPPLS